MADRTGEFAACAAAKSDSWEGDTGAAAAFAAIGWDAVVTGGATIGGKAVSGPLPGAGTGGVGKPDTGSVAGSGAGTGPVTLC